MAFSQPDKKTVGSKLIEPTAFFYVNIKVIGYRASTTQKNSLYHKNKSNFVVFLIYPCKIRLIHVICLLFQ